MTKLVSALSRASRGEVLCDVPLAPRTSVRVGGPAQLWVRPRDPEALVAVLGVLCDAGVPWFTMGGGANSVVGDLGVEGAVLKLGADFAAEQVEEGGDHALLTLGAGAPIARFVSLAREQRGVGVAWASGIPGTVGGMVTMNAGTATGAAANHLEAVEVATPDGLRWLAASELRLRAMALVEEEARAAKADVERRRSTQPLTQPNSGSVFVNPSGAFAGRLVEQAGLKGTRRGGAQISEKHANFIVNLGDATAADVIELIALARRTVLSATGVELHPEVRLVGTFRPALPPELEPHHFAPVLRRRSACNSVFPGQSPPTALTCIPG